MTADAHGNFSGKRLVIFGAGYVGSAVAREAVGRGLHVTALTRNSEKAARLRELGVTTVVADLAEQTWHAQIDGRPEFVLNCVSSGGGGLAGYERSYFGGMKSILAWAQARGGVGTLVYTSSTSVYPQGDGAVVDETASTTPAMERAKVLTDAEGLLVEAAARGTVRRYFILRLAGIYGPERHYLLEQVRSGEIAGRGDYRLNLAHRDDITAAILAAFAAREEIGNEIFNVADDRSTPKTEIVSWLAARLGLPTPSFTGAPATGRRTITPDRVIANGKIRRMLGWQPRFPSYREGYENLLSR
jgi:nucleoside-diphosphate-sugar epimerase